MAKIKPKPVMIVIRVGTLVDYDFRFSEFGVDDKGSFAVVERLPGVTDVKKVIEISMTEVFTAPFESPKSIELESKEETLEMAASVKKKAKSVEQKISQKENKSQKPIGPIRVVETLDVRLTDEERDAAAKNAANLLGKLEDAELQFKNLKASISAEIKTLKEQISRAKSAHNTGLEYRSVTCEQHFNVEERTTWYVYRGEQYGLRAMNEKEERETRSNTLFGDAPMLPNKIDPSKSIISGGDELAKKAAKLKSDKDMSWSELQKHDSNVLPNGQSSDRDLIEVINQEKSRNGGKKDHISN